MTIYHVNPETGRANICRASSPAACPLKGDNDGAAFHSNNKEEARQHGIKLLTGEHGETKTLQKSTPKAPVKKDAAKKKAEAKSSGSKTLQTLQKEIDQLRNSKAGVKDKAELNRINGEIRGKSIRLSQLKRAEDAAKGISAAPELKVDQIPDNSIKFVKSEPIVAPSLKKTPVRTIDKEVTQLLDKNVGIEEKKKVLSDYLNNSDNVEELRKAYKSQGYDYDNSSATSVILVGPGTNSIVREAIKQAEKTGATKISDVILNVEDAVEARDASLKRDYFTEYTPVNNNDASDDFDLEEDEEAPDFLADDPDFAIEDEEEEDLDEE